MLKSNRPNFAHLILTVLLLALIFGFAFQPAAAQTDGWRPVSPGVDGIEYMAFRNVRGMDSQDRIHVARMDRSKTNLTLESLISDGYINLDNDLAVWNIDGTQPTSKLYNDAINYWGDLGNGGEGYWGTRSNVVVAINGDHRVPETVLPYQGQVQSGWFAWYFQNLKGLSGFGVKTDGQPFIGNCTQQLPDDQRLIFDLSISDLDNYYWKMDGINVPRKNTSIFLYTPQYGIHPDRWWPEGFDTSVEVIVQLSSPLELKDNLPNNPTPENISPNIGVVQEVRIADRNGIFGPPYQPPVNIQYDQIALSAYGSGAGKLAQLSAGQQIGINVHITDGLRGACQTPSGFSWKDTYTAIGIDEIIVTNGSPIELDTGAAPRTAIAYNDQYIYFVVAEGHSILEENPDPDSGYDYLYLGRTGITFTDLAEFLVSELNALWAVNMDGGGSSSMIVNGYSMVGSTDPLFCPQHYVGTATNLSGSLNMQLNQIPRAGSSQDMPDANLPLQMQTLETIEHLEDIAAPEISIPINFGLGTGTGLCQRGVPNGIAMVAVEPMQKSGAFSPPQVFQAVRALQVRQGPGKNYALFGYLPFTPENPQLGEIIPDANNLNGVYATGTNWWYVQVGDLQGWVDERQITSEINLGGLQNPGGN